MYQLKVFSAATPLEVEESANLWLRQNAEIRCLRVTQVTSSDVVQVTSQAGIQRFSLVILYELLDRRDRAA